jgi:hypothetical protein
MSMQLMKLPIAGMLLGLTTMVATSGQVQTEQRTFTIAALEPRGGANKPDQTGRWEVVVYLFTPSQIIVNHDDDVTFEFVGVNGKSHPITIAGYEKSFELKRGHVTKISKADKVGCFPLSATRTHRR